MLQKHGNLEELKDLIIGYTIPIIEHTSRARTRLYNLARGHALSLGRNYVTKADLPIVIRVVLSTGPVQRVKILDKLLSDGKEWDTSQITNSLEVSRPTARKTMIGTCGYVPKNRD